MSATSDSPRFERRRLTRTALIASACLVPLVLGGCLQTIRLDKLSSTRIETGLRNQSGRICPRTPVQIKLVAHGMLGGNPVVLESWEGPAPNRAHTKGRLDFRDFVFTGNGGILNADGWLFPWPDVLDTTLSGYTINVFLARTMQPVGSLHALPDYTCIATAGMSGAQGERSGMDGAGGSAGPHLRAMATFVRTPFYDKLLAVRIDGDMQDFVLAPADRKFTLVARGGNGADGADGRDGRDGVDGHDTVCEASERTSTDEKGNTHTNTREICHAATAGEDGGDGRNGGDAGNGGAGGSIDLILDRRFPELRDLIGTDVRGGSAGRSGRGGEGGDGGSGGYDGHYLPSGRNGIDGRDGNDGDDGPDGSASVRLGDVSDQFADLPGITIY